MNGKDFKNELEQPDHIALEARGRFLQFMAVLVYVFTLVFSSYVLFSAWFWGLPLVPA